jgi:hypothetical protein
MVQVRGWEVGMLNTDAYELANLYELECDGEDSFFDDTELSIEAIGPYYETMY